MGKFLHDVNLLIDVFLKKGLLLDVCFADYLDCVEHIIGLYIIMSVLLRASMTSPKAPLPIVLII
jgi:hypothetical protein